MARYTRKTHTKIHTHLVEDDVHKALKYFMIDYRHRENTFYL